MPSILTRQRLARMLAALGCVALLLAGCAGPFQQRASTQATPTAAGTPGPKATPTFVDWGTMPRADRTLCTPRSNLAPLPTTWHTLYTTYRDNEVVALNTSDGSQRWISATGGDPVDAVLDGANVYVHIEQPVSAPGGMISIPHLAALGAADGALHWQADLSGHPYAMLAAGGVLYLTTSDGSASALDGATGTVIWSTQMAASGYSLWATLVNSTLYVAGRISPTGGGFVTAMSASNGAILWSVATSWPTYLSPIVANGLIYVAETATTLTAFDAATGTARWRQHLGAASNPAYLHSAAVSGTGLYVAATSNPDWDGPPAALYAFNATTGALCWIGNVEGWDAYSAPVLDGGVLYHSAICGNTATPTRFITCIYAMDARTEVLRWKIQVEGTWWEVGVTPTSLIRGVVYINTAPVRAVRADTGATIWTDTEPSSFSYTGTSYVNSNSAKMLVIGTTIYAGYANGDLRALDAADGSLRWSIGMPRVIDLLVAGP